MYAFYVYKNKNNLFFLSVPIILLIYATLSHDFLFHLLQPNRVHFVPQIEWIFIYDLFFPRFFGSLVMGSIYLLTLISLIIYFRKEIFCKPNNYLPLIFILFFSYLVPFLYGLLFAPVLFDRYIIFVLAPILILMSSLIFEVKGKFARNLLILLILIPTFINLYLETGLRERSKPDFDSLFVHIEKSETKNLTLSTGKNVDKTTTEIVENYLESMKIAKKNNFKLLDFYNLPNDL